MSDIPQQHTPDLPDESGISALMSNAKGAASRAYAPYSGFRVGAAILTSDGRVFAGSNVENASYGLAICAERNAATTMAFEASDGREIISVAIYSPNASPCYPCGACRQFLREFGCREVIVQGEDGSLIRYPFEEMLPHSFGPESL